MSDEAAPRRRGPYAKSRLRRREFARATLDLVIERGHDSVSVTDVAARCGVPEATVLYHFPTKDDLFVAAIQEADRLDQERFGDEVAVTDLEAALRQVTAEGVAHPNARRLFAVLSAAATDADHAAHAFMRERQEEAATMFAAVLRARQEAGLAHPEVDAERFGRQMVAVWDGLQLQWLTGADFDLVEEVVAAFRALSRQDAMEAKRALEALVAGI